MSAGHIGEELIYSHADSARHGNCIGDTFAVFDRAELFFECTEDSLRVFFLYNADNNAFFRIGKTEKAAVPLAARVSCIFTSND